MTNRGGVLKFAAKQHQVEHREAHEWCAGLTLPVPPHGNSLSAEKVRRLLELEEQGLARSVMVERLGVSLRVIDRYLRLAGKPYRAGYPRPPRR